MASTRTEQCAATVWTWQWWCTTPKPKKRIFRERNVPQFYLFSDGCTDQVGGEHKRKIMSKHFREKILEYSALPMKEQAEKLTKYIFDYKGDCPQTDDIALIAFKL